ncbi:uncharacterized protein SPPG_05805 [Spizellomyces punctatus DAOM BR117]|uniref:Uncharacterized protein n=1 Tax=Spizellomyces punctatus (strain DAOM BR117) TaxID=645134 RepID=A0A0L0HD03_SPIPD|nr:uncharacterized protein SPPG_05805 [Spizellomyces punctatus DAOM BR117]KNC98829.1 hypothetical protein SPPG_05805 [Spizellomyces punctatus DAOM BR117]|eukprot:XP_016606869.1 hypothetical protein SPPG_05805 [Spizellomyces punctatus DAOM BR117]
MPKKFHTPPNDLQDLLPLESTLKLYTKSALIDISKRYNPMARPPTGNLRAVLNDVTQNLQSPIRKLKRKQPISIINSLEPVNDQLASLDDILSKIQQNYDKIKENDNKLQVLTERTARIESCVQSTHTQVHSNDTVLLMNVIENRLSDLENLVMRQHNQVLWDFNKFKTTTFSKIANIEAAGNKLNNNMHTMSERLSTLATLTESISVEVPKIYQQMTQAFHQINEAESRMGSAIDGPSPMDVDSPLRKVSNVRFLTYIPNYLASHFIPTQNPELVTLTQRFPRVSLRLFIKPHTKTECVLECAPEIALLLRTRPDLERVNLLRVFSISGPEDIAHQAWTIIKDKFPTAFVLFKTKKY